MNKEEIKAHLAGLTEKQLTHFNGVDFAYFRPGDISALVDAVDHLELELTESKKTGGYTCHVCSALRTECEILKAKELECVECKTLNALDIGRDGYEQGMLRAAAIAERLPIGNGLQGKSIAEAIRAEIDADDFLESEERSGLILHLKAEMEFGERMIKNHMTDGHLEAVRCREGHRALLKRWLKWLGQE